MLSRLLVFALFANPLSRGHNVIQHGGGIEGFNTELAYYPEDNLTVVALANVNGQLPADIATKLAGIVHG
jgi:hypothetical protein